MTNFKTYQKSIEFYHLCRKLILPSYLKTQLLRASSSITLNLAEGAAKFSKIEQRKFYRISYSSLKECDAIFDLHNIDILNIRQLSLHLGKMLFCLIKSRQ
jgi:four helix bundle protein